MHYVGSDLDAMAEARNYYRWILGHCRPDLGRIVLEHGAGIGTFSTSLLGEAIERLYLLEPAENLARSTHAQLWDSHSVNTVSVRDSLESLNRSRQSAAAAASSSRRLTFADGPR